MYMVRIAIMALAVNTEKEGISEVLLFAIQNIYTRLLDL